MVPGLEGKVLKMDGPSAQGFLSLTGPLAPRVVVSADAASFIKRGAAGAAGCVEGLWKKVLKMDRPLAGGFLSLTALRAEGCGLPCGQCL